VVADGTYNGRYVWVKDEGEDNEKWLFYDSPKRFWVIDDTLGDKSPFTSPDCEAYCLQWDELEPFSCDTWYFYNSTADEMPRPGIHDVRIQNVWTMSVDSCEVTLSSSMNSDDEAKGATSTGAIIGYVIAAMVVLLCCIVIVFIWKPCGGNKGNFSFKRESSASALANTGMGGVTTAGMGRMDSCSVEMETSPRSTDELNTAGMGDVARPNSGSVSMDGDMNETK